MHTVSRRLASSARRCVTGAAPCHAAVRCGVHAGTAARNGGGGGDGEPYKVTVAQVKELKELCGAGLMDCKKALEASKGDMAGAQRYIKEQSMQIFSKRTGRGTAEGLLAMAYDNAASRAVCVELNCEEERRGSGGVGDGGDDDEQEEDGEDGDGAEREAARPAPMTKAEKRKAKKARQRAAKAAAKAAAKEGGGEAEDEDEGESAQQQKKAAKPSKAERKEAIRKEQETNAKRKRDRKAAKEAEQQEQKRARQTDDEQTRQLPNGLAITELRTGTGAKAKTGKKVGILYKGMLKNGKVFDSSLNKPFKFKLFTQQVIKGMDYGVLGMRVGGKRRITIPSNLAYGAAGVTGSIPPRATLIFEIELVMA